MKNRHCYNYKKRIQWLGWVLRMRGEKTAKWPSEENPGGSRTRPRVRWREEDSKLLGITKKGRQIGKNDRKS